MSESVTDMEQRETRSFLWARDPSIDRRFRPRPNTRLRLVDRIGEEEEVTQMDNQPDDYSTDDQYSKASSSATTNSQMEQDSAMVYLRFRPVDSMSTVYQVAETGNVLITYPLKDLNAAANNKNNVEKHFSFSNIFECDAGQKEIYTSCVQHKISAEESFSVLTYGTSGSGKTFTLLGNDSNPGIIPRALGQIFSMYKPNIYPSPSLKLEKAQPHIIDDDQINKEMAIRTKILKACPDKELSSQMQQNVIKEHDFDVKPAQKVSVFIWVSFVELYNEAVFDLLLPPSSSNASINSTTNTGTLPRKTLKIIGNDGKVFLKDITQIYVMDSLEALQVLKYGLQRVTYASTAINANSSRSHCIFFINIMKYFSNGEIDQFSYKFCDLAGSERLVKTGNVGNRMKEAQSINKSLMVLGRCLDAATMGRKKPNDVLPYRDSKLTMLLQRSLLGKEKLSMIVNIMPVDLYYEENMNVLNFASIARNITFQQPPVKQSTVRYSIFLEKNEENNRYIEQLLEENICLQSEVERLRGELEAAKHQHNIDMVVQEQKLRNELVDSFQVMLADRKRQYEKLQEQMEQQERVYETKIATLKRKHEREIEELEAELDEHEDKENLENHLSAKSAMQEPNFRSKSVDLLQNVSQPCEKLQHDMAEKERPQETTALKRRNESHITVVESEAEEDTHMDNKENCTAGKHRKTIE